MNMLTTYDVYQYLMTKLKEALPGEDLSVIIKNGYIDKKSRKVIGVFQAPHTRSYSQICMGGLDCSLVSFLPVNIVIRWGDNARAHDIVSTAIYKTLLQEGTNFFSHGVKIAHIQMLDSSPIALGRDEANVCESSIRMNVHYYM